jgi:hypothetical protein
MGPVAAIQAQRDNVPFPSIERAWRASGVSKVDLANALWSILERRIRVAIECGTKGPPIMQAVLGPRPCHAVATMEHGADPAFGCETQ